ncbi:MAG TPA: DUF1109 domain-containing protein [Casimicrobiaceae bacterium]
MRTDELVKMLATGTVAVEPGAAARRFALAVGLGALGAALLMALLLGVRHDLRAVMLPMFSVKLAFAACLALASIAGVYRLSRPGAKLARVPALLATTILAMWALAAFVLIRAQPGERAALLLGQTWDECPFLIALLSAPAFISVMWALRSLAPTRLRLAGAAAGFAAGALGALAYSWHCPELGAPFIALWYLAGILIPTAIGALVGSRVLRW